MYRLVIAEKPSVAMSIAKVLEATTRREGHMEGNGWLVSWCIGHLAGLAEPAAYNPAYDKWRREDLPILPENWRFTIGRDKREAEVAAFEPTPFYTVELTCGGMTVTGERIDSKKDAAAIAAACEGIAAIIQAVERKEKSERPPALYDLTALQRETNRVLGYTAQQTLDYLQALYEKKLCTYPRTDSRYLTDDMESTVPDLVSAAAVVCGLDAPGTVLASQVCNSGKVSDHHAIVPTKSAATTDLSALPLGEREILRLAALGLLRAVCPPHRYAETAVAVDCGGHSFTTKGRTVLDTGWRTYAEPTKDTALPDRLAQGQELTVEAVQVTEGKTAPPKHYTEDTILASMESAGAEDMPDSAERKGIGTPATRAAILEKLVATGQVERKKARKITSLLPTQAGSSLVAVLPEALQSPLLTADWESRLGEVERGELSPEKFMESIVAMVKELVGTYQPVPGAAVLFPSDREAIGPCPRCGGDVIENKKGFFCGNRECRFALWKDSKFFSTKRKKLTKAIAAALLTQGRVKLTGCFSEKTGKTYNATAVLEDDGAKTNYKLVFDHG